MQRPAQCPGTAWAESSRTAARSAQFAWLDLRQTDPTGRCAGLAVPKPYMKWTCKGRAKFPPLTGHAAVPGLAGSLIFPAAIPGKKESPRRRQATERHATAKYGAADEVPDLRRASRRAEGHLAMRRGMQQDDIHRPNRRIAACQATIHRQSTCSRL